MRANALSRPDALPICLPLSAAVHVAMALPCQACLDLQRIPLVPGGPITPHARTQPELDLAMHADSPLSDAVESYRRRIILQSCYLTVSDD